MFLFLYNIRHELAGRSYDAVMGKFKVFFIFSILAKIAFC
jgi:hypothetical protein